MATGTSTHASVMTSELLQVEGLKVHFPITSGVLFKKVVGQVR